MGKVLRDELTDPLGRGYSDMTDAEVADDLNTEYRTRDVQSLSGDQCFQATDATEFSNLTDHKQNLWLAFCGRNSIDPWAGENVDFVKHIFGDSATTVSNLGDLRTENCTRAEELGLGQVQAYDVHKARNF